MSWKHFSFCLISFIPLALGISLVVIGAFSVQTYGHVCKVHHVSFAQATLIPGSLILVLIVMGWLALCIKVRGLYYMFLVAIFLTTSLFIGFLVIGSLFRSKANEIATECVNNSVSDYKNTSTSRQLIDVMQSAMHCCGMHGSDEWSDKGVPIPISCCKHEVRAPNCTETAENLYKQGCINAFANAFIRAVPYILVALSLIVVSFLFLGFLTSIIIKETTRYEYQHL